MSDPAPSDRVYNVLCLAKEAAFTRLPLGSIDPFSLGIRLRDIGRSDGAAVSRPEVA
jgi:hypothetical protein